MLLHDEVYWMCVILEDAVLQWNKPWSRSSILGLIMLYHKKWILKSFDIFLDTDYYDLCVIECFFHSLLRYANQHGLPILKNVCLPRLVATQTIIDELTPKEGSHHLDLEIFVRLSFEKQSCFFISLIDLTSKLYRIFWFFFHWNTGIIHVYI